MNTPFSPKHSFTVNKSAALIRILAVVISTAAFIAPSLKAAPITVGYSAGNSTATTTPGVKLGIPTITDPSQSTWQLTSFTWLSSANTGANPTGRGYISIFDATLFDPTGMTAAQVNSATTGLIARSDNYDTSSGAYLFASNVILEGGKSYYILNSAALSTTLSPVAPYPYGFISSGSQPDISRWVVSSGAWASQAGAPNFSASLTPVAVPESKTTALIGIATLAIIFRKRHRLGF